MNAHQRKKAARLRNRIKDEVVVSMDQADIRFGRGLAVAAARERLERDPVAVLATCGGAIAALPFGQRLRIALAVLFP